ncbi:MAG: competence/damage-inducible protein A [Deltaproteobacteria bacterium]|nr:competence/damage-inducible protein A [Deltaproteobacteria bacterium]MBM4297462.1 competence/damage-inducible protein A [Deltaproteobacteria bacterium]
MIERVVVLSTGDELMTGRVVDTNSTAIASRLAALGISVPAVLKVGDDRERLLWALRTARDLGDLVIGTGGLGPTADDLTTEIVAQFIGRKLKEDTAAADGLRQRFASRKIDWTENNLKQALFPEGSTIIPNPAGTAPGFRVDIGGGKQLVWLSGVPREMSAMMTETILPWIRQQQTAQHQALACTFKLYGLTESKLDDLLHSVNLGNEAKLSFRAHYPDLSLRLAVTSGEHRGLNFVRLHDQILNLLGGYIYAEGDTPLEEVVGQLLMETRQTLALAESCTGGYISHRITSVPGSSNYYFGGAVTYANDAKKRFLGVQPETLDKHGAVSRETALEMSQGIREQTGASIALSVTGIAGPSGGTPDKPVGTVWMSISMGNFHDARTFQFTGDRERIIQGTSQAALNWLRTTLLG